ncbi:MAG: PAS domain-containing protein, partial [Isosphaeraceae bacterium]
MKSPRTEGPWPETFAVGLFFLTLAALAFGFADSSLAFAVLLGSGVTWGLALLVRWWRERRRWISPTTRLAEQVTALAMDPRWGVEFEANPQLGPLIRADELLASQARIATENHEKISRNPTDSSLTGPGPDTPMTRSGLYEAPSGVYSLPGKPSPSTEWTMTDMVNRLDPNDFRWIESSPREQAFLGWSLRDLRTMPFLDVVHEDDRTRVQSQFHTALEKGEVHGLVFRVRTRGGKVRAVSIEVATRYASDVRIS